MLDEYSELSRRVAREQEVRLLDLRTKFTGYLAGHNPDDLSKGILTYDGVHLNAGGNRFVADAMMEALAPYGVFASPK
jgi:lysophospholipase L1-like esterase